MKQESVAYKLTCPNCGNSGIGTIFEDHNPASPKSLARRVETLPKGMTGAAIDSSGNQVVLCEVCNIPIPY